MYKLNEKNTFINGENMQNYGEIYRIAMFGHRDFNAHRQLDEALIPFLRDLIRRKKFIEIYIGRDGEFDIYAASLIKRFKNEYDDFNSIELHLILPYDKRNIEDFEKYYDQVYIPISVHPRIAIVKRNEWMVNQADLIFCYIERQSGGAYKAVQYAEKKGKKIVNIACELKT